MNVCDASTLPSNSSSTGRLRDVAHRARDRSLAVQRALRAFQHLDALEVHDARIELVETGERERRFVEVNADERVAAVLVRRPRMKIV